MSDMIQIHVCGETLTIDKTTTFLELAGKYQDRFDSPIILARINGKLKELYKKVKKQGNIDFVTTSDKIGHKVYVRTATFILTKAVRDVIGADKFRKLFIHYSIGNGYFCEIKGDVTPDEILLNKIRARMCEIIDSDVPIIKKTLPLKDAVDMFENAKMYDKCQLFKYRRASSVNVYMIDDFVDYNYGYMAPSTGCIRLFDLQLYNNGFVLVLPDEIQPDILEPFAPSDKLFNVLWESAKWSDMMGVSTVGELNNLITAQDMNDLILVQEALQEKKIAKIADTIAASPSKRVILIAGPSSSGKTTFSHRLSIQLQTHGLMPHPIPVDDYFVNREDTPLDEYGKPNYECLGALDIDLFNEHMSALLEGREVELPVFNFVTGRREYKGHKKKIGPKDILVIEGIHALNDQMTYSLHKDSKFKIYISALTQLNVDEHNRIPTTDGRLIRRIVRDAATRGANAQQTIAMWDSVRRGEEENIFPYQEGADIMFNSALIYELSVLKQFAEPLLFSVPQDSPQYDEAKRLLKFLDYFLGVSSENVPKNSILREFIGGSCFKV